MDGCGNIQGAGDHVDAAAPAGVDRRQVYEARKNGHRAAHALTHTMEFRNMTPEMITTGKNCIRQKILRTAATLSFVTVCALAAGFVAGLYCTLLLLPKAPGTRDFIIYWATGQQLTHHDNPYDREAMSRIERAAGLPLAYKVGFMRNPPWTLPLVYPLGFISPRIAWLLWSLLMLACLAISVRLLWIMYGRPRNRRYLLGLSFGPALLCLLYGQTSLFALLGLVLFLRLHRTRPFLAGISLWLCALKPHLFLPFGVVLLAWVLVSRSYKLVAGAAIAMAASCAITFAIDPLAWNQYLQMARASGIQRAFVPCLSFLLRDWLSPNAIWLQYLPAALGCAWALSYYWLRRQAWDWTKNGSPLMLVSILTAPYTLIYDQGLLIPALLRGALLTRSRNLLIALAFLSSLVEIALYRSLSHPPDLFLWTYWTAPAWLIWYIVACTPSDTWAKARSALLAMKPFRAGRAVKAGSSESGVPQEKPLGE